MKHRLDERHKRHLARLGVALDSEHLEVEDAEYQQHYADWKITLPRAAHEILHMKVLGHAAWKQHAQTLAEKERVKAQTITHKHEHRHRVPEIIIAVILLLLGLLIVPRAHCQFSKINSIQTKSAGSSIGFHASPFIVNCSTNMSCIDDGTTFTLTASSSAGTAWDSITNPTAGGLTLIQFANGNDFWTVKRKTDTSPTGNFLRLQTALGADLFAIDITGQVTAGNVPTSRLTGTLAAGQEPAHTGDMTNSAGSLTTVVGKVNGIAYSATAAAHSVEVVTTANTTATAKVVPDCTDTGGNHLNFTQSTDAFSCGTSSSGGGATNAAFWQSFIDRNGSQSWFGNNDQRALGYYLPVSVQASTIGIYINTADAGATTYSWGLANSSGTLVCHAATQVLHSTGVVEAACVEGTVTFGVGKYYFVFTASGTAAAQFAETCACEQMYFHQGTQSVASTGGTVASFTPNADSWSVDSGPFFWLR